MRERLDDVVVGTNFAGLRALYGLREQHGYTVAVRVGEARDWRDDIKTSMAAIKPGRWDDEASGYDTQINPKFTQRINDLISQGKEERSTLELDVRYCTIEDCPDGNREVPTVFSKVTPEITVYREEIFGPALRVTEAGSLDKEIALINANPHGKAISASSGVAARKYSHEIKVGQVGVKIPIPMPALLVSFTGSKGSFYGDLYAYGKQSIRFFTEINTSISRWFDSGILAGRPSLTINMKKNRTEPRLYGCKATPAARKMDR